MVFRLFEQSRLGSYDPILFGTLCNVDSVTRHPEYQRFMTLGMAAFMEPPGDRHKRFVDAQKSTDDKVLALSLFTLFVHENRHFWDSITTCSGLHLAHAALNLQYEFITRCIQLMSRGSVYFPFSEWVRDRTKLERISPALATIPPEASAFAARAERFLQERQKWNSGDRDLSGSPSSTQIIEALALLVQGEAVRRYFEDDAWALFCDAVRAGETGRWYLGAIDYLHNRLPELDVDGQGLLLEMALYGRVELLAQEGSPAAILPYLVEQLEKTRPSFPASFAELFALCDGYLSLLQGVGPAQSYGYAIHALFGQINGLNELGTAIPPPSESGPGADITRSVLHDLFDCVASTANLGSRLAQKVLFAGNVGNWRITNQIGALYDVPRSAPYFESSNGTIVGSPLAPDLQPLVGTTTAPGWRSACGRTSENVLFKLMCQLSSDEPVHLLYIFTPRRDDVPAHIKLSWKLFPQMFLCRLAIAGPSETDSLASVLLSEFLSGCGNPVYARKRRIAPLECGVP
jgi:hypothetical protein